MKKESMMSGAPVRWRCCDREWLFGKRPLIMGIVNVTPDSFSDGGRYFDVEKAVEQGMALASQGADILDIGGESTRPGADPVDEKEELRRVVPVVRALKKQVTTALSIDTRKAAVAGAALAEGAHIINDVSALTHDARMGAVAREYGAGVILMHMRGEPRTMQQHPAYDDVTHDVVAWLRERIESVCSAGMDPDTLALDPGIGFGKTLEHNVALLQNLKQMTDIGHPVVVGLSRKRMVGMVTGRERADERLAGSLAGLVYCILQGAHVMRVHDVAASYEALRMTLALRGEE